MALPQEPMQPMSARRPSGFAIPLILLLLATAAGADTFDDRLAAAVAQVHAADLTGAASALRAIAEEGGAAGQPAVVDAAEAGLADIAFRRGDYGQAQALHEGRRARAAARGDARVVADAEMELALVARRQGRFDLAARGLEAAIAGFRAVGDRSGEAEALVHHALVLLNQGAYTRTLERIDAARELGRQGATVSLDRAHHYLGLLYLGMRDLEEARGHLDQALSEARRQPDPMRAAPVLGSLARIANAQSRFEEALRFCAESDALSRRFDSVPGLAYGALERGRALLGLGRLDEARESLEASRRLSLSVHQDRTAADATFSLGRVALAEGDPDRALALFDEAIPNYLAAGDVPQLFEAYRLMVPLLQARGDLARALDLAGVAIEMQEQISGREISRRVALLEYRHEVADNARRIELLTRDNEIKALRLEREALDRRIATGVITGLLGVVLVLGWLYRRSARIGQRLARSNADLQYSRQALAAANAELADQARALEVAASTDPLTGIANRREVLAALQRACDAANADGFPLAVLLIDVDRFKEVNDTWGHGVGDRVLVRIAHALQALLPPGALAGRYGGEEFLVVLPQMSAGSARAFAEGARTAAAAAMVAGEPAVTLSIGVAVRDGVVPVSLVALVEAADHALYAAKAAGRDRVEMAAPG